MSISVNVHLNERSRIWVRDVPVSGRVYVEVRTDESTIALFGSDTALEGIALGILEQLRNRTEAMTAAADMQLEQGVEDLRDVALRMERMESRHG